VSERRIRLDIANLTRVEGEGSLQIQTHNGNLASVQFAIHEPPRLFEKLLLGRSCYEVPEISARICGICPLAYQLTSIQAFEQLFSIRVSPEVTQLRTLCYLGEWLQSHALHIHFLAAPDFLGFEDAFSMGQQHPELLTRGMRLQRLGHKLVTLLGGRAVHPVSMLIGGISRFPSSQQWQQLGEGVEQGWQDAVALLRWATQLTLPDSNLPFNAVSLSQPGGYPLLGGEIISAGQQLPISSYASHFQRQQQPHSTALYSYYQQQPYLVGPLARLNNNHHRLPGSSRSLAAQLGFSFPCHNMFASLAARALEICVAIELMTEILAPPCPVHQQPVPVVIRAGECCAATEAPRGMIYHWYRLDGEGRVQGCEIIPPTSQNQAQINRELALSLKQFGLQDSEQALQQHCERLIRNYDPCISCATHFLRISRQELAP